MARQQDPASGLSVLMLPWLAHGHVSPFLELARRLSNRGFHVYFCSTPVILSSIRRQLHDDGGSEFAELVDLPLPSLPGLPPHYHTTKNLPLHLMPTLKTAFDLAEPAFSNLLDTLRPGAVVYDFLQPWAPAAAASRNIPAVLFLPIGAAAAAFLCHLGCPQGEEFPFSAFQFEEHGLVQHRRLLDSVANGISNGDRLAQCIQQSSGFILIKTFREIEAKYIDYLSLLNGKEYVPLGPLVQDPRERRQDDPVWRRFSAWLSDKPVSSVVFVSFGSEYFMSREEMAEIAYGLELSGVGFIWVVRFPTGEELRLEEALPGGFLDRLAGRGMVVDGWAPQASILAHHAVGGFVTHCGWGSVMEAISWGVPIVALPLHLDQPLNAKLVAELAIGVEVSRGSDGIYKRGEVAEAVRAVVVGKDGEGVRRRAMEMSDEVCRRGEADVGVAAGKLAGLFAASTNAAAGLGEEKLP